MKKIFSTVFAFLAILSLASCSFPFFNIGGKTETPEVTVTPTEPATEVTPSPTPVPTTFNVSFVINGHGEQPNPLTNISKLPIELPVLIEDGWTFEGWYYDREFKERAFAYDILNENTVLYAKWTQISYSIIFNNNGHGSTVNMLTNANKLPTTLPILDETGYIFDGWYYDSLLSKKANGGDAITNNTILYAKWTKASYSISFNINGHGEQPEQITNISKLPTSLPILTDNNYDFIGWYYDSSCTKEVNPNDELTSNITLYAKWTKKTYTITFVINDHGTQPDNIINTNRIPYALPELTESYYSFDGWYLDEELTEPVESGATITSNITLYAKWIRIAFNVTFDSNGFGANPESLENISKLPNSLPYLTYEGYQFMGWFYDEELTDKAALGDTLNDDITLYAKWLFIPEPDPTYTITYNINGHGKQPTNLTEQSNLPNELPNLTEEGYEFLGWFLDEEFQYEAYPGSFIVEDTILYAKWQELYDITYNTNGHGSVQTVYNVSELPNELPELTDDGYRFLGWYFDEEFTSRANANSSISSNVTLYAKWQELYDITYETFGLDEINPLNDVLYLPLTLPTPSNSAYIFIDWYYDEDFTEEAVEGSPINGNTTLYAKWELITYTIKFENNGLGNKPSNINLVTSIPNSLPELTEDGYRFLGWYTNAALTNKVVKGETINSDIILYAKWETITYTISFNNYGIGTKPSSIEANRLPNPLPAITGETHILMGWYYDESFTDQAFADDLITTNTTLYAKWYEYVPKPERSRFYTSSSSSAVITNGSGMSQTITYSTSPGWRQIECDITNYNTAYESIEIKFTVTKTTKLCFSIKVGDLSDQGSSHNDYYPGVTNTYTVDLTKYTTASSFRLRIYADASETVTETKSIQIISVTFIDPNNPNGDAGLAPTPTYDSSTDTYSVNYIESNETFDNPDRGFYNATVYKATTESVGVINPQDLYSNNLLHLRIDLGAFSTAAGGTDMALTDSFLTSLRTMMQSIENAGACAIVRFAYTFPSDVPSGTSLKVIANKEPSISMMQTHIRQFVAVLNDYPQAITALECGLVGPWGEMHSSDIATQSTWNTLFDTYLEILNPKIKFLVRQPNFIYKYYGYTIDNLEYFDYENCNRIGLFNDGYLGSATDLGTFTRNQREKEITFLEKLESFPYGGEVVQDDEPNDWNQLWHSCDEMFRTNLSYLNIAWNDDVIARWAATPYTLSDPLYQGKSEFDYINNHMGYRFVAENLTYSVSDEFTYSLKMKNVGFGGLYKEKTAYILLDNGSSINVYNVETYESILDDSFTLTGSIDLSYLHAGEYTVYFVLADNWMGGAKRGIRFANYFMYNEELQANRLTTITVKGSVKKSM